MKIKITPENEMSIAAALDAAQARCRKLLLKPQDVYDCVDWAEAELERLRLPKGQWVGARYRYAVGGILGVPNTYKAKAGARGSTGVIIERGSAAWFIISVTREGFYPDQKGWDEIVLTMGQKAEVMRRFSKNIATYSSEDAKAAA